MGLISFNKPEKLRTQDEHNDKYSSELSYGVGTYVSNMSDNDIHKWKGKIKYKNTDHPQIEIRKDSFVTVVAYNGYNYKSYKRDPDRWGRTTVGTNIHIGAAGPIQMSFDEWDKWRQVVEEAKEILCLIKVEMNPNE